jgi:hypothetical protein
MLDAGRMPAGATPEAADGPWNPGVKSRLPARLLPLSTIFRPENVFAGVERVKELHDLTGLDFSEMVCFRPERLALHELLIRVTADLWVSDGSRYEDLGINFRSMIATILARYVDPDMGRIANVYNESREALRAIISQALTSATETTSAVASRQRGLRSLFASRAGRRSAVERGRGRRRRSARGGVSRSGQDLPRALWQGRRLAHGVRVGRFGSDRSGLQRVLCQADRPSDRAARARSSSARGLPVAAAS